jgi:hypothetical protein
VLDLLISELKDQKADETNVDKYIGGITTPPRKKSITQDSPKVHRTDPFSFQNQAPNMSKDLSQKLKEESKKMQKDNQDEEYEIIEEDEESEEENEEEFIETAKQVEQKPFVKKATPDSAPQKPVQRAGSKDAPKI